ncbi:hypothetical protein PHLGIDRAFT_456401 [Phlebiopsis gigantea 11061_1 CR5-6]|uniref:Uncharacterized protein n=1 Tax=Phlebiopsis gigantea (strain 11061_1 CR5-6) TaxID=745531 RepID=A0A0C3P190_PHLG1|nr:hypothetical protein PHLGIDRAFT_456401 [Phlebiopsis gigantea 11061_1 CR5-6]
MGNSPGCKSPSLPYHHLHTCTIHQTEAMPRETKKKISDTQQSDGSDDNFAATIAQQVQSSWEKKKRESEARFLSTAKAELDRGGRERSREFVKEVDEMQAIMERFVSDYAAIEDKIRALWQQLLHAQDQYVVRPSNRVRAGR